MGPQRESLFPSPQNLLFLGHPRLATCFLLIIIWPWWALGGLGRDWGPNSELGNAGAGMKFTELPTMASHPWVSFPHSSRLRSAGSCARRWSWKW